MGGTRRFAEVDFRMLPNVAETSIVVNTGNVVAVDNRRQRGHDRLMSTRNSQLMAKPLEQCESVADRLIWVLTEMGAEVGNMSEWGLRSGKSRGTVATIIRRKGSMRDDVAEALALSAGVSPAWLQWGHGSPDDGIGGSTDPYPERAKAIAQARKGDTVSRSAMVIARRLDSKRYERMSEAEWRAELLEITVRQLRERAG